MKVAIISHTPHFKNEKGNIVGWGPTVKEINMLLNIAETIVHIAPLHKEIPPVSSMEYCSKNIRYQSLLPSGGKGFHKLSIILTAPYNLFRIIRALRNVDIVQFRAPTGIGLYVLPFLRYFSNKKYWVKYAGNWNDPLMPLGNKLQKKWLQNKTKLTTKITVNGYWNQERKNIISFENPCLDDHDRVLGEKCIRHKNMDGRLHFCFVGALNRHKGVHLILQALAKMEDFSALDTFHFIGDGTERAVFEDQALKIPFNIVFHGFLNKNEINKIYEKSHFILLPSKSEGFPKVIGEAMNFGCIPIVSDVSCISDYIKDDKNGFLLETLNADNLISKIDKAIKLEPQQFLEWSAKNYILAEKFTYTHYNQRIESEIFN